MNDRLNDILMQAGFNPEALDRMGVLNNAHRFAELIIKECVMIVEGCERTDEVSDGEYQDYEASTMIKQHFGVEQ